MRPHIDIVIDLVELFPPHFVHQFYTFQVNVIFNDLRAKEYYVDMNKHTLFFYVRKQRDSFSPCIVYNQFLFSALEKQSLYFEFEDVHVHEFLTGIISAVNMGNEYLERLCWHFDTDVFPELQRKLLDIAFGNEWKDKLTFRIMQITTTRTREGNVRQIPNGPVKLY